MKNCTESDDIFQNPQIVHKLILFILKKLNSKSITKTILKVFFLILKRSYTSKIINFKADCVLKKVIEDFEKQPQAKKEKKKFSVINSLLFPNGIEKEEEIKSQSTKSSKRYSEQVNPLLLQGLVSSL